MLRAGRGVFTALIGGLVAWSAAAAAKAEQPGSDAAQAMVQALASVCRPAVEGGAAPRDLALAAGFRVDGAPPAEVQAVFPATKLGAVSLVKQVGGVKIRITSTVLLPPSTIFSCLISSDEAPPDLLSQVAASAVSAGYTSVQGGGEQLLLEGQGQTWSVQRPAAVDKLIAVRRPGKPMASLILSYRVDAASLRAAKELSQLCKTGGAPRPEITCAASRAPN